MSPVIDNERFRRLLRSYPIRAVALLYNEYHRSLRSISFGLTHDIEASKDIVQETFYHVWKNSERLSDFHERSIENYLVKVVRYKSITYFKQSIQLNIDNLKFLNGHPTSLMVQPFEQKIIEAEIIADIRKAIESFPKRQRECFLMQVDRGLTIDQIARELGITSKAVEKNLTSVKKKIRKFLKSRL
ncbi:MAG TPA: sigma-70 family RNA polymerase sigma factor [Ohtaekwangia sp.]|uniref:RNA polymerase sigma factor n=1 Tax=Ohtaekwangia sp. TaxID=2066019 RepID=UPI002F93E539